jgi:hypothetical protein
MNVRRATGLLLIAAAAASSSPTFADPAGQARFHDELARDHYQAGRFAQALREFFLEQRISPNPRIAFNIALCFQMLKRKEDAFQYFTEYLASDDADPERRSYAERGVASLEKHLALVEVRSDPAGSEIYVDRRELGSYGVTPRVLALVPGEHEVWVERTGYREAHGKITVGRAERQSLDLAPAQILGTLKVTSAVAGTVFVRGHSGETLKEGPAPLETSLPPGSYEVLVKAGGHLPWFGVALIEVDGSTSLTAVPQRVPAPTGGITVTSNVPGSVIELDGDTVGFSPAVLSNVAIGTHSMRVVSPSLEPWSGTVPVTAEQRSWLTVSLEEPPKETHSPATWIAGGVGAAALGTAGVLAFLAAETYDDFENAPPGTDRNAIRERGMTLNTAADVALITGLLTTATAVILYFTTSEVRGRPSTASLTQSEQ